MRLLREIARRCPLQNNLVFVALSHFSKMGQCLTRVARLYSRYRMLDRKSQRYAILHIISVLLNIQKKTHYFFDPLATNYLLWITSVPVW